MTWLTDLFGPAFQTVDDFFYTNEEQSLTDVNATNAEANLTLANAQLVSAQNSGFTEDEQKQLMLIILGVIGIVTIIGVFKILNKTK